MRVILKATLFANQHYCLLSDCKNAGRSDLQFRSLLAAISRLLPVVLPLSPHQTDGTNPAYLLGILLVRHVTLLCQPHRLLPDEPNVSVKYVTTSYYYRPSNNIHGQTGRGVGGVSGSQKNPAFQSFLIHDSEFLPNARCLRTEPP